MTNRGRTVALQAGLLAALGGLVLLALLLLGHGDGGSPTAGDTSLADTLAFSAGGSIYTVASDGSALREVIPGDRGSLWNAAPAISPDGTQLVFTRDLDLWVASVDGQDVRLLADVGDFATPPAGAASNWSLGAQSAAWSPDGEHIAYVMARIGGSGVSQIWVMRPDGSAREEIYLSGGFLEATWLDDEQIAAYIPAYEVAGQVRVFRRTGEEEPNVLISDEERPALTATRTADGRWLVGPFLNEGPILYGEPTEMREVATGISPALSPDGRSFAYFRGDTLRVASVDGTVDEQIVDLAPLGGRDRHFAETPACSPEELPGCSYRPAVVSWTAGGGAGAASTPGGEVEPIFYRNEQLGIEFSYPASWEQGAPPMPYASCFTCTVFGPEKALHPYGIELFTSKTYPTCGNRSGGCPVSSFIGNRAFPKGPERALVLAGREARQLDIDRQPPLGLTNETGETTLYQETWTVTRLGDQALFLVAFYRDGDMAAEQEIRAAYEALLASLRFD